MKEIVRLEDFFEFEKNEPIKRLGYNKLDLEYKQKVIKKMQELGMKVKVDRIGNICATLKGNGKSNKSIVMGSHTDSVENGGQYDGPVGVIAGLKTIENIKEKIENKELELNCDLKVIVWACEESNRFGKACLGSKWIEGTINDKDFAIKEKLKNIKEEDKKTLEEAISEYISELKKSGIENIEYVDKVISMEEILKAYELHIEQYQYLSENNIDIGVISSITAPYRMGIQIEGKNKIIDAATLVVKLNEKAKEAEVEEKYRATVPIIDISEERTNNPDFVFNIELRGLNDHSGSTPMNRRKDAILAASKFILELNRRIKEEDYDFKVYFNEIHTKNDSTNKVAGDSSIELGIDTNGLSQNIIEQVLTNLVEEVAGGEKIKSICKKTNITRKKEQKENKREELSDIKIDVRMQTSTNPKEIFNEISDMIIEIAHETGNNYICKKTDKALPVETSKNLINQVHEVCIKKGIKAKTIPSWAGHDVAHLSIMEKILIFIKSVGGSHNPKENTTKKDLETGITVLTGTVEKDIEQVYESVKRVEYLEDNYASSKQEDNKKTRQDLECMLLDVAKAKKMGITISKTLQTVLKKSIMASRTKGIEK